MTIPPRAWGKNEPGRLTKYQSVGILCAAIDILCYFETKWDVPRFVMGMGRRYEFPGCKNASKSDQNSWSYSKLQDGLTDRRAKGNPISPSATPVRQGTMRNFKRYWNRNRTGIKVYLAGIGIKSFKFSWDRNFNHFVPRKVPHWIAWPSTAYDL